jgi:CBS domain-containing protein
MASFTGNGPNNSNNNNATNFTIEDTNMTDVSQAAVGGPLQKPSFIYQPPKPLTNAAEVREEAKRVIADFLKSHTVYQLLPRSGKVVVFGVDIPVKLAFYALTEHGIPVAPIWDEETNSFVGVFTLTDFVEIIRYFYRHGSFTESLTAYSIHAWRSVQKELKKGKNVNSGPSMKQLEGMVSIGPEDTLFTACCKLRDYKIHYLPVLDSAENRVLATIAHLPILKYLVREFKEPRRLFDQSIYDLGIGVSFIYEEYIIETLYSLLLLLLFRQRVVFSIISLFSTQIPPTTTLRFIIML